MRPTIKRLELCERLAVNRCNRNRKIVELACQAAYRTGNDEIQTCAYKVYNAVMEPLAARSLRYSRLVEKYS